MIFFVPMCQIFWHMCTGQRAVPLEPALWLPLFFLIFNLSAQCVRHFAPFSSKLESGPTKLTLVIFWNFFFKKKFSTNKSWMIDQYILQDTVYWQEQLFSTSWLSFLTKKTNFAVFWWFFFVPICQIFWHIGTGQRAVPNELVFWHPLFF